MHRAEPSDANLAGAESSSEQKGAPRREDGGGYTRLCDRLEGLDDEEFFWRPSLPLDKRGPDLSHRSLRPSVQVSCRETQHPKSAIHNQVLAPVVSHESVAMVAPVVLDDEMRRPVEEVGSTDESPG